MEFLNLSISNIKNIRCCDFSLPLSPKVYGLVGGNGSGKSTIMLCLSSVISPRFLTLLQKEDLKSDSRLHLSHKASSATYTNDGNGRLVKEHRDKVVILGMYEGSLFYGDRFRNSVKVDSLFAEGLLSADDLVEADQYVKETLSLIIHGDKKHYSNLFRLKNRHRASQFGLQNTPYFLAIENSYISQYRMSSGECLLISLIHFIYNSIVRRSLPTDKPILMLIDEIELALHPMATMRLVDLLDSTIKQSPNITSLIATHSPELIKRINPRNLFQIETRQGVVTINSPCYPSYAIRDVYRHDGFDYLLLVEDKLAKHIISRLLEKNDLQLSRLIHISPAGGWRNVLELQNDLICNNVLGTGKTVFSILDGDIKDEVVIEFNSYKKLFLPIPSVEKLLFKVITMDEYAQLKKKINDKYFLIESIDTIYEQYARELNCTDNNKKILYEAILTNLSKRNITEESFVLKLTDDIIEFVDFSAFLRNLTSLIS